MFQIEKKDFGDHFGRDPRVSVTSSCADYMSETSSLMSELDETDYEVRKLTALAFRSLACPHNSYMDVFNSRASTELSLSLSEDSNDTNKWSTYVGLSDASVTGMEETPSNPNDSAVCASSTRTEESGEEMAGHSFGNVQFECVDVAVETQEESRGRNESRTVPKREIQLKKGERSELTVFRSSDVNDCQVEGEMQKKEESSQHTVYREDPISTAEVRDGASDRQLQRAESTEECSKKAKFASCHISNVISKKMQFEQELMMERVAVQDAYSSVPSTPSSAHLKEFEFPTQGIYQELKRQNSNAKSESDISVEDLPIGFRKRSCDLSGETTDEKSEVGLALDGQSNLDIFGRCENSVFRNWKESNPDNQKGIKSGRAPGVCGDQFHPTLGDLSNLLPEKPTAQNISEDRYMDGIPQITKEISQTSYLVESKQTGHEDKASHKQSGNTLDTRNASRSTFMPQSQEMTSASGSTQEKHLDLFGTVEQLAPNIGSCSKIITLDPKYQTLPASFKFETDDCRNKDPQFDIREPIKQRTKGPIHHVRDVRKLVKNTYGALTFSVTETKPPGSGQVLHPDGSQQSTATDRTTTPVSSIPTLPIYIQCKSISWKGSRENYSHSSVDKKYWTYAGSTDTSRLYSSDINLLIPSDTKKSKMDSPKNVGSVTQSSKNDGKEGEVSIQPTDLKNSKKKIKDDKPEIPPASNNEDPRVSPIKVDNRKGAREKQDVHLAKQHSTGDDCNLFSETNKLKIGLSAGVENQSTLIATSHTKGNKVEPIGDGQNIAENPEKDSAESIPKKEDSKVPTNKVGPKREDPVKLHSQKKSTGNVISLKEDFSLTHGKSDSKREVQDRAENQNRLQKISTSRNNNMKTLAEKSEPKRVENLSKHLSISTLNINDTNISSGKETSEKKVHSRLDHQKTFLKMSSSNGESTQELTGKEEFNKESEVRKLGSKNNISENSILKTEEIKGKDEHGREGQVKVEQKSKPFGNSTLNSNDIHSSIGKDEDIRMNQLGLENRSLLMSSSLSQTVDITKLSARGESKNEMHVGWQKEKKFSYNSTSNSEVIKSSSGKYETVKDMQVRLENQNKIPGNSNEEKSSSGKTKTINESQVGLENRNKLQDYCTQSSESIKLSVCKSETEKESQTESENQDKKGKVEQVQASEKTGLKMLKESQPIKDSYVLSLILEEESKNNLEPTDAKMRNKQPLSLKNQLPNHISAQPSVSSSVSVKDKQTILPVKPADHQQTVKSAAKTSTHKSESHGTSGTSGTSAFAINIPISAPKATYQPTTSQIHSSSAEFNLKTLPPVISAAKLAGPKGQDQDKHSSSAVKVQPIGGAATQEQASMSLENVNYLAIPIKEQKAQVPTLGQIPSSPHSAAFKANPSSTIPYFQHQRSLEIIDPQRQEKQTISRQVSQEPQSPGTSLWNPHYASPNQTQPQLVPFSPGAVAPNFVEAFCEVPQSPQELDNPHVPCFQYPQTQRKMLVDPETGKYYFVDAPIQPPRKMLLDPETGQYVEVMMPQHPYGGVYQVPFSPYLLNPGVMGPSYLPNMPYPGLFVGPPVSSQRPVEMQNQLLSQQGALHDKADTQHHKQYVQRSLSAESPHRETLYYIPTGMTLYPNPGQPGLQQAPVQAKSCAEVKDSKATGIWSMQHTYGVSTLLPHGRPSSFMVE
ncbi:uro-adherence factor A-like [Heptranchias perlo]|uniref:uro-adherence factor A-like n=1 Tax=Heptranchias perlo TaxID=212740 RepID=UPI0035598256